ncbi:DUF6468 domain-containing protein [Pelagibius sp. Alg239-R121]|uniref:DUF6468 domain-containing protein n=1 Tax=Pelagibius sp. Alg239-R121 TaxID=2993448 RepID=UPI0024A68B86|nr:DUF6468 domain-containing protein [Pelagibius sp. Alg239-R121]
MVATIVYAAILDRKLGAIRKSKSEMESLIRDFAESTVKAEQGLAELKQHAGSSGTELQQQVDGAAKVLTDLKFLVERGESLSNQLESVSAQARETLSDTRNGPGKADLAEKNLNKVKRMQANVEANVKAQQSGKSTEKNRARHDPDTPISERLNLTSENPGAGALLKALQRMR